MGAEASRRRLLALRTEVEAEGDCATRLGQTFCAAFAPSANTGFSFHVVLDARPHVGRRITSPAMSSPEAALALQSRIASANNWSNLRAEWIQWLTTCRRLRWRSRARTAEEAEALVCAAEQA